MTSTVVLDLPVLNINNVLEVENMVTNNNVLTEKSGIDMEYLTSVEESILDLDFDFDFDLNSDEMTKDEFSYFLINMRENLELNQSEMAEKLGINKNSYNAFENGKRLPKNWCVIKDKVNYMVKNYVSENRGLIYKKYINEEMGIEIINLHNRGKNIVQIGIELELDEEKVSDFLISNGFEPKEYTLNW